MSQLTVYKASAGSGKTSRLAIEYAAMLVKNPALYRHILAITFTNKAAEELKERVIKVLHAFSKNKTSDFYFAEVAEISGMGEKEIVRNAKRALFFILHDYNQFYISTIDSFFSKILIGFAFEMNIHPMEDVELDVGRMLQLAVDDMLSDFDPQGKMGKHLLRFSRQKMNENTNWDIRNQLQNSGNMLLKEEFIFRENAIRKLHQTNQISAFYSDIEKKKKQIEQPFFKKAEAAYSAILSNGYAVEDFSYKMSGPAGYISQARYEFKEPKARPRAACNGEGWLKSGESDTQKIALVENDLTPVICTLVDYYDTHIREYQTYSLLLQRHFEYETLIDLSDALGKVCAREQKYLLSDVNQLLYELVVDEGNDAPFILEKAGTRFMHYLLDEFQDTSQMQWGILKPLVREAADQNYKNTVVGDIKQSIYRWRNSDWRLMEEGLQADFKLQLHRLEKNHRSGENIVRFNNTLFRNICHILDTEFASAFPHSDGEKNTGAFSAIYKGHAQQATKKHAYVQLRLLEKDTGTHWHDTAISQMIGDIKDLQDGNISAGDITVLVRRNKEAEKVAAAFLEAQTVEQGKYCFNVVSAKSLRVSENPAIKLLLHLMHIVADASEDLHWYTALVLYHRDILDKEISLHGLNIRLKDADWQEQILSYFPDEFATQFDAYAGLTVFEMCESLITIFGLNTNADYLPFLAAFEDEILKFQEYHPADITSFLDWFEQNAIEKELFLPKREDAIRIMTMHEAKGLQFPYVCIPFLQFPKPTQKFLWSELTEQPYNKVPLHLVSQKAEMNQSLFSDTYIKELFMEKVDDLNLMYVAFTRAEKGLWISMPEVEEKKKSREGQSMHLSDAPELLQAALHMLPQTEDTRGLYIEDLPEHWDAECSEFRFGSYPHAAQKEDRQGVMQLQRYICKENIPGMRFKHPGAFLNLEQDEEIRDKAHAGSIKHAILEQVVHVDDLDKAVQAVLKTGRINSAEARKLKKEIRERMAQKPVKDWFSGKYDVLAEREILAGTNRVLKPDRVMMGQSECIVVDYKFGMHRRKAYEEQVRQYAGLLKDMGYRNITAYLWYIELDEVQQVDCD